MFCWVNELIWREFYRHLIVIYPRLSKYDNFNDKYNAVKWRDDDSDFKAWCEGKTGYPLVDAAMRQLVQTGWMHNRLRMVVASFLTKHLLIDWRKGERFFMKHLIDGDLPLTTVAGNGLQVRGVTHNLIFVFLIPLLKVSDLIQMVNLSVNIYQSWKKYLQTNPFSS